MMKTSKRVAELQAAFMLLTRLPAGQLHDYVPSLSTTKWAFPLVGLVIGSLTASIFMLSQYVGIPDLASAILAISGGVLCTGALHEDGLADSADGLGGGQDRARKLDIMKDSRIGSYGVLALILVIGGRVASLSELQSGLHLALCLISIGMFSRLVMVFYLEFLPAARDGGLGKNASEMADETASMRSRQQLFTAVMLTAPAILYLFIFVPSALVIAVGVSWLFAAFAERQIGGQTGDICGAGQLISETAALICLAAVFAGN